MIQTKRVYEPPAPEDGCRFLVDRIWPRGTKKDSLKLDGWLKEVAPSDTLRSWYGHDISRWDEFRRRYFAELDSKPETWHSILGTALKSNVTLLYSARETEHNNAVALKDYLEERSKTWIF
ncbi:MAG: DUF488 domain-containing protein [Dehalococcoidales bacterium]|nr:DUF488 domain-containing protein [Dehalococcoidales bacterium]